MGGISAYPLCLHRRKTMPFLGVTHSLSGFYQNTTLPFACLVRLFRICEISRICISHSLLTGFLWFPVHLYTFTPSIPKNKTARSRMPFPTCGTLYFYQSAPLRPHLLPATGSALQEHSFHYPVSPLNILDL